MPLSIIAAKEKLDAPLPLDALFALPGAAAAARALSLSARVSSLDSSSNSCNLAASAASASF
jgi:hypothetical protein